MHNIIIRRVVVGYRANHNNRVIADDAIYQNAREAERKRRMIEALEDRALFAHTYHKRAR